MKIGITGASGHIGNNLVRLLVAQGHDVRIFVHVALTIPDQRDLVTCRGDLLEKEDVRSFVRGLDAVFHLAARIFVNGRKKWQYYRENIMMADNILEAVKEEGCRYIYFSSVHAYDPYPRDKSLDEWRRLMTEDHSLYSRSKAISQQKVLAEAAAGVDAVVLNPSAVIGPHDYRPSLQGKALLMMARNRLPVLIPGGYNWVDVRDVAEGAAAALEKGKRGEAYLLSGHNRSLVELNDLVRQVMHIRRKPPVLPYWVARVGVPFLGLLAWLKGEEPLYTQESVTILQQANLNISHAKASRDLGYNPRPLEETVKDTIGWFRENGMIE